MINRQLIFTILIFLFFLFTTTEKSYGYELDFSYIGAELVKKESGREVYRKKSGTIIYKYSDREEANLSNGTRIIRYSNGKREVYPPDGVKIYIDYDGSSKYLFTDGREKVISMDGVTPFGLKIDEIRKTIRRKDISVNIIYSAEMSDDIMNKYVTRFYDELTKHAQRIIYKNKIKGKQIKIILSNCRFGKTGFCRRNNRNGMEVLSYRDGKKIKAQSIKDIDLYSKDGYLKSARDLIENILVK